MYVGKNIVYIYIYIRLSIIHSFRYSLEILEHVPRIRRDYGNLHFKINVSLTFLHSLLGWKMVGIDIHRKDIKCVICLSCVEVCIVLES